MQSNKIQITIVISEFHSIITERLLNGALDAFNAWELNNKEIMVHRVPGAFEIPSTINQIIKNNKPAAIIAVGCVIRGETSHYDFVAGESARCLADLSLKYNLPIINGILTTENNLQAMERSKLGGNNRGYDAMLATIKMIKVYEKIQST
tara:strand:+ start:91 stop:540 length:450 start_codon:yes stop_codon:yes gene_type:complete